MKQFVLLFRQGPRNLSEKELKQRGDEVRAWAIRQRTEGRILDARILDDQAYRATPDREVPRSDTEWRVSAVVFLGAHDLAEATRIAQSHPSLRYGISVEVRGWSPPASNTTVSRMKATTQMMSFSSSPSDSGSVACEHCKRKRTRKNRRKAGICDREVNDD